MSSTNALHLFICISSRTLREQKELFIWLFYSRADGLHSPVLLLLEYENLKSILVLSLCKCLDITVRGSLSTENSTVSLSSRVSWRSAVLCCVLFPSISIYWDHRDEKSLLLNTSIISRRAKSISKRNWRRRRERTPTYVNIQMY